ncbi:MAG: 3'-5' exonuclease [Crocinitomicaceae bacterium]|nr:3'-5' exonuclease [Crocinitomicaceae bacterium]|tara:strand:+ start:18002 stop:18721 length:720 start_codon:yes stop_codon:yes gene_type:complete
MLKNLDYSKILFLDIETVPLAYNFNELDDRSKILWDKKTKYIQEKEEENAEGVYPKAGIYAEFGKVICISVGFILQKNGEEQIRVKSFSADSEPILLQDFADLLNSHYNSDQFMLCAHNGKEFDIPFLARRFLINGLKLPHLLNVAGKKPWEIKQIDTMELWKFGDFKHYTSLDLLTHIFNIPTPKDDIDGSQVAKVYYEDSDLERIIKYCEKDVVATIQLLRKYRGEKLINEEFILST